MQSTHLNVPLKNLRPGHEAPNHPGNARITGREDGIAELAAHIHARGKIDDLLIYEDGVPDTYFVANGNRSLAALRMIYGDQSAERVSCKLTTPERAYEDSLAVAVLVKKFHPVDEYEGFAKLQERGKSDEEIGRHYGKTLNQVKKILALGALSPKVRDAWRAGQLDAEAAQAFTLAPDHATQDKVLDKLLKELAESNWPDAEIEADEIEHELKVDPNSVGHLLHFVGIDAYEAKKGKIITRDLFGTRHKVSDEKLLKKLADDKLDEVCKQLVKVGGWSFASRRPNNYWDYGSTKIEPAATAEEDARIAELQAILGDDQDLFASDMTPEQRDARQELLAIEGDIIARAYTPALREKSGCWVDIDPHHGALKIEYGKIKPKEKAAAAAVERREEKRAEREASGDAGAERKPAPESKVLSNALKERLEAQLIIATRDGIAGDPLLAESPFAEAMAKTLCSLITPDRPWHMPDGVTTKLPTIRQALTAEVFNAAMAKRFDAENYFSSAPKPLVLKAIAEGLNQDEARRIAGKTKAEIWKFALENLPKTGWLPKELRAVHYKGPGSDGYKKPAAAATAAKPEAPAKAKTSTMVPAKKPTKKTAKKKR